MKARGWTRYFLLFFLRRFAEEYLLFSRSNCSLLESYEEDLLRSASDLLLEEDVLLPLLEELPDALLRISDSLLPEDERAEECALPLPDDELLRADDEDEGLLPEGLFPEDVLPIFDLLSPDLPSGLLLSSAITYSLNAVIIYPLFCLLTGPRSGLVRIRSGRATCSGRTSRCLTVTRRTSSGRLSVIVSGRHTIYPA